MSESFLEHFRAEFEKQKKLAEGAVDQVSDETLLFRKPGAHSNSVAVIMKHVGGNLRSRWSDFLTTDGEKSSRDRDSEFVIATGEDMAAIRSQWENGWAMLFSTLQTLDPGQRESVVVIRGEFHTVERALIRCLAHISYHVGQIVYLSRLSVDGDWKWLTIPPGKTAEFNAAMARNHTKQIDK